MNGRGDREGLEGGGAVFLFLHAARADTFRAPVLFAGCSGELKAAGRAARVLECWLDRGAPDGDAGTRSELSAWLRGAAPAVVVLQDVPDPEVFDRVRAATRCPVVLAEAGTRTPPGAVDWVVHHAATNPGALVRAVEALLDGRSPAGLPNVVAAGDEGEPPGGRAPCADPPVFRADPDTDVRTLPAGWEPPSSRAAVYVNAGCPYGADAARNPFFAGADLSSPGLSVRGCAFCFQGGDYRGLPPDASAERVVREVRAWRRARPGLDEVVLWDESPLRYLPLLVRRLRAEGLVPLRLCLHARPDALVRERGRLEEALGEAGPPDAPEVSLAVNLVGFESFSADDLARLNKGLAPGDLEAAVAACRDLADRWPRAFAHDRYRSSSFVLFTPWTRPADLRANVAAFRRVGMTEMATGMGRSRLRLYPNLPLWARARADGLLADRWEGPEAEAEGRFGYSREHPWRFADPVVATAFRLYDRLFPRVDRRDEVALLEWVLDRALACPGADPDAEAARFDRLAALRARLERGGAVGPSSAPRGDAGGGGEGGAGFELALGTACNQGCPACERDGCPPDPSPERLRARLEEAARSGARRLSIEGFEPTLSPLFPEALRVARTAGFRQAEVLTNGRRFAYPRFAALASRAGLTLARVKFFGPDAAAHDARTRTPGAHVDVMAGLANLRALRLPVRGVLVVRPDTVGDLAATRRRAAEAGVGRFEARVPLRSLPREGLDAFLDALEASGGAGAAAG